MAVELIGNVDRVAFAADDAQHAVGADAGDVIGVEIDGIGAVRVQVDNFNILSERVVLVLAADVE